MGKLCNCGKNQWGLVRHWEYERMGMGKIFCRIACKVEYLKRKQQAQNIEAYQKSKPPNHPELPILEPPPQRMAANMLDLAKHIVNQKAADFEPERFEDHYEEALTARL
jgi:hypothetical protein